MLNRRYHSAPEAGMCLGSILGRPRPHAQAPRGLSWCRTCGRTVMRGLGRWWR
jgi:hypothetical protein